jgi:hypothetical protein
MGAKEWYDDNTHHVIARKERSEGRGNPLYAMVADDLSVRSPTHSGSPRAYSLARTMFVRTKSA